MDDQDLRIRNHVYGSFVREQHAPTPAAVSQALGLEENAVADSFRRLHDAHALVLEPDGSGIRMLNPFSVVETPYRVFCDGREWFGNCAWDALAVLGALRTDGRVESECPDCGEQLRVEVADGRVAGGDDPIFHVLVPARHWWDDVVFT